MSKELYKKKLAEEWIDWVETPNPDGTREKEINPYIENWLNSVKPNTVADIGCGQGAYSELVKDSSYIGIDESETLIKRAKELYPSLNKNFKEGNAYNIPLEDNSVDAAISIWVWSHLENLEKAADEMFRILKPNGHLLLITASPETYEERKGFYSEYKIEDKLLTGTFELGSGKYLNNTTLYLHTKEEIETAVTKTGFKINKIQGLGKLENDKALYVAIEASK